MLRTICNSESWSIFSRFIQSLSVHDRLYALGPLLQVSSHVKGYRALARLIQHRYFSTVLTTNIDSALEDALNILLIEEGLMPHAFQMLVPGRDTDEYIVHALDNSSADIRIVKLHGSLRDHIVPLTFPNFSELHFPIDESIRRFLNQDLLVVGSIEHEGDIGKAMLRYGKSSTYYALPSLPASDDDVIKLMRARKYAPEDYVIAEEYGHFDNFFCTLEALLLHSAPSDETHEHVVSTETSMDVSSSIAMNTSSASPQLLGAQKNASVLADGRRTRIAYCYAHEDEALCNELDKHLSLLKKLNQVEIWYDRIISAGAERRFEIEAHVEAAEIILLLISPDFIASDYLWNREMKRALELHEEGKARVVPILLRPVIWKEAPFSRLQVLPIDGKAVTQWQDRDEAFRDIVIALQKVIQEISHHE